MKGKKIKRLATVEELKMMICDYGVQIQEHELHVVGEEKKLLNVENLLV